MPGNFSHANVVTGQTLTANKYNGDFQNLIDNFTPTGLDDFAVNAAQFLTTQDPGEPGSEILPTSLAGELAAIRAMIGEMKGVPWIQSITGKSIQPQFAFTNPIFGGWQESGDQTTTFWFTVPQDYFGGQMSLTILSQVAAGFGNVRYSFAASWWRAGQAPVVLDNGVISVVAYPSTVIVTTSFTMSSAGIGFPDAMIFTVQRTPGHASDTATGDVAFAGSHVTYLGWAGR